MCGCMTACVGESVHACELKGGHIGMHLFPYNLNDYLSAQDHSLLHLECFDYMVLCYAARTSAGRGGVLPGQQQ